jgi:hypothetical protein
MEDHGKTRAQGAEDFQKTHDGTVGREQPSKNMK